MHQDGMRLYNIRVLEFQKIISLMLQRISAMRSSSGSDSGKISGTAFIKKNVVQIGT
jgi:hypothetical protein